MRWEAEAPRSGNAPPILNFEVRTHPTPPDTYQESVWGIPLEGLDLDSSTARATPLFPTKQHPQPIGASIWTGILDDPIYAPGASGFAPHAALGRDQSAAVYRELSPTTNIHREQSAGPTVRRGAGRRSLDIHASHLKGGCEERLDASPYREHSAANSSFATDYVSSGRLAAVSPPPRLAASPPMQPKRVETGGSGLRRFFHKKTTEDKLNQLARENGKQRLTLPVLLPASTTRLQTRIFVSALVCAQTPPRPRLVAITLLCGADSPPWR
ncbi:hypothetical protein GNI_074630 [Gregarina niphandrodes]|uniref:Uncharacterized protein n=1 Tax=Gregarina niphandrodes TaxID=110365 RepID=A0A023B715_GRENI|nr:hypothetical protein GNI_074630 [Gregarina niphandrodes]EZG66874.1 hypothetical protein GNI_074630 [Gregarina niphandrodes]|eukprot:XP_011130452.1 hypothetical protein GNI_074630 [Gregarina niphandrodes]